MPKKHTPINAPQQDSPSQSSPDNAPDTPLNLAHATQPVPRDRPPRPHSPEVTYWAQDTGPEIPHPARDVLGVIARYCDPQTGISFPSEETIAQHLGRTRRHVIRQVKEIRDARMCTVAKVQGQESGRYHNEYRLAGVDTGWEVVVPQIHLSKADVYSMQFEIAELHRLLAENGIRVTAQVSQEVVVERELNNTEIEESLSNIRTTVCVTTPLSPNPLTLPQRVSKQLADLEAGEIEQALQDRWHILGPSWKKGLTSAISWFTRPTSCSSPECPVCPGNNEDVSPHRVEFWRQWRAAEIEASKPPEEENTPAPAEPDPDHVDEVSAWVTDNAHRLPWKSPGAAVAAYRRDPELFACEKARYEKQWSEATEASSPAAQCAHCGGDLPKYRTPRENCRYCRARETGKRSGGKLCRACPVPEAPEGCPYEHEANNAPAPEPGPAPEPAPAPVGHPPTPESRCEHQGARVGVTGLCWECWKLTDAGVAHQAVYSRGGSPKTAAQPVAPP